MDFGFAFVWISDFVNLVLQVLRVPWHEPTGSIAISLCMGSYSTTGLPPAVIYWYPFIHQDGGKQFEAKFQSEYSIPTLRSEALQPYHFTTALPPLRGFSQQKWSHHLKSLICYLSCISYEITIAIKDREVGLAWVMKNITTIIFVSVDLSKMIRWNHV